MGARKADCVLHNHPKCLLKTTQEEVHFYPVLTGSKTPTSKLKKIEKHRWESTAGMSPIGSTNNQWGMRAD